MLTADAGVLLGVFLCVHTLVLLCPSYLISGYVTWVVCSHPEWMSQLTPLLANVPMFIQELQKMVMNLEKKKEYTSPQ